MDSSDDFDLLGRAVARVLRETFAAAEATRHEAARRHEVDERELGERLAVVFAEVEELRRRAAREQVGVAAAFEADVADARDQVNGILAEATAEAEAIRAKAYADAEAIVAGAGAEITRARELVAEARVRLDGELKDLVRDVHRAVDALERTVRSDHALLLDRASTEARMILRQARLHHRATAREVDRMIEAAANEASALRSSALSDAARIAARVRGVVDLDGPRAAVADEPVFDQEHAGDERPQRFGRRGLRPVAS